MRLLEWLRGKSPVEAITHTSTVDVTLRCRQCGGTNFKAPAAMPMAHDKLTCLHCEAPVDLSLETKRIEGEVRAAMRVRAGS
jgi:hypothetical protein